MIPSFVCTSLGCYSSLLPLTDAVYEATNVREALGEPADGGIGIALDLVVVEEV